jgi:hypothetical protein
LVVLEFDAEVLSVLLVLLQRLAQLLVRLRDFVHGGLVARLRFAHCQHLILQLTTTTQREGKRDDATNRK